MKFRQILFSAFLCTGLTAEKVNALDVFDVYKAQTPVGCLEDNISIKKEVSLIDLIRIGICNNPSLNIDYMGLK
ncbi:MAG: hypothetical protein NC218_10455, partial [Acetobacter sp.]|nr:hypothetical protein [Acetobacter sp.]